MLSLCSITSSPPPPSSGKELEKLKTLPIRPIPGSHGFPLLGPLKDRLDYFWFQGQEKFFRSRMSSHNSPVFRTNIPPTFFNIDPRIVALLDCPSFSSLFDSSVVDKRNVLVGPYMPSTTFTGNTRVGVYLDPTEPQHAAVKQFCLHLLRRSSATWFNSFQSNLNNMLSAIESNLAKNSSYNFLIPLQKCIFSFLCKSIIGADPSVCPDVGEDGFLMLDKWLLLQILPTVSAQGLPQPFAEIFLHSFPFPFFLVAGDYKKLYNFVANHGAEVISLAETEYGLNKDEAIHNILFVLGFNAFGGFSVFLPTLITTIGRDKTGLKQRLKEEVRNQSKTGEFDLEEIKSMELVCSTVYEVLRLNPPVPLQYGRAREDFELRSNGARFLVKKGELLCGYQPIVMRDPMVFDRAEEFVADRFVGEEGKKMLNYLYWSNGPETGKPSSENKQCAAKDFVVATAWYMVAEIFRRYDDYECGDGMEFIKLEKATAAAAAGLDVGMS